jgi:hypothetical protein
VDVSSGVGGGVSVALAAASGGSVGDGMAGVQAERKNNMDTIQIKTLVSILNSSFRHSWISPVAKPETGDTQYNDRIKKVKRQEDSIL